MSLHAASLTAVLFMSAVAVSLKMKEQLEKSSANLVGLC